MEVDSDDVLDNPLEHGKIVERVLRYLPPPDLKRMRLVSILWSKEGAKKLVKKCYLRPKSCLPKKKVKKEKVLQSIEKFGQFLEIFGTSTPLNIICDRSECSTLMEILEEIPDMSSSVRELKFTGLVSSPIQDLANLMEKLPNLDILRTSTLNFNLTGLEAMKKKKSNRSDNSEDDNSEDSEEDDNDDNNNDLDSFFDKLKSLYELHLDHFIRTDIELGDYLTHLKKLSALKSLSLITSGSNDNVQRERVFLSSSYHLGITHLTWKLDRQIYKRLANKFILKFAPTLTYLNITIGEKQESTNPWTDDWYIPYELKQLKTLEIAGTPSHIQTGICISLQMTRLEKLVIKNKVTGIDFSWETHRLANRRKLCSNTIKEVEVDTVDCRDASLMNGRLWPNLKSMKIGTIILDFRYLNNFDRPFTKSRNLEHLEFDLSEVPFSEFSHYEKWMAGMSSRNLYESGNIEARDHNSFCVRDLADLKSLKITGAAVVGDFLIYNCIQDLTNLQSLHLKGARISKQAYDDLKEQLNPTTSILITN